MRLLLLTAGCLLLAEPAWTADSPIRAADSSIQSRLEHPDILESMRKAQEQIRLREETATLRAEQQRILAERNLLNAEARRLQATQKPEFAAQSTYRGADGKEYVLIIMNDGSTIKTDALAVKR